MLFFCFSLLSFGDLPSPSLSLPSPSLLFIKGRFGEEGLVITGRFMNISGYKWGDTLMGRKGTGLGIHRPGLLFLALPLDRCVILGSWASAASL